MGDAGTVETAEDCAEVFIEVGLEVGVFLVGTDYVWRRGEGVGVSCYCGGGRRGDRVGRGV